MPVGFFYAISLQNLRPKIKFYGITFYIFNYLAAGSPGACRQTAFPDK
jgi:hypothetical protein